MAFIKKILEKLHRRWYNQNNIVKGGCLKMNKAIDVARFIINCSNKKKYYISNLRLQKILYFAQMEFILNNSLCFEDEIQAWDYGPVVPNVYNEFKRFGASNIPQILTFFDKSEGILKIKKIDYKESVINSSDRHLIEKVIDECSQYSTSQLVRITHAQLPWIEAHNKGKNSVISVDSIKSFIKDHIES